MTVSKPKMVDKKPSLTKFVCGGKRSKTTKIAWHYTGASECKAINTINNWFNQIAKGYVVNGKYAYASSHFVMELDGTIYSYIPMSYIAWTTNAANYYSIGVECATTGSDDHYTDAEYKSMVKLGAWLAQYYDLDPRSDFIRHYDVTKKICPRYFVNHSSAWTQFKLDCYNFMKGKIKESDIKNCTNGKGTTKVPTSTTITPTTTQSAKIQCIKGLQTALNEQYKTNLDVDGSFGPKTQAVVKEHTLSKSTKKNAHCKWMQNYLNKLGYSLDTDGYFGAKTLEAVMKFQKDNNLKIDGYFGIISHTMMISLCK